MRVCEFRLEFLSYFKKKKKSFNFVEKLVKFVTRDIYLIMCNFYEFYKIRDTYSKTLAAVSP